MVSEKMQINPFEIVVPLFIRSFIRETNGEILAKKRETHTTTRPKQRKMLPHKPIFGTVEKTIFTRGTPGLLPDHMESTADVNDEGNNDDGNEAAPWEQHLQYGVSNNAGGKQKKTGK